PPVLCPACFRSTDLRRPLRSFPTRRSSDLTVSRDIKELHLVKVPTVDRRYAYSLPADQRFNPIEKLKRLIMDAFVKIDHTSHFIVLNTLPGNAQAVGALIDHIDWYEFIDRMCVVYG